MWGWTESGDDLRHRKSSVQYLEKVGRSKKKKRQSQITQNNV